MIPNKHELVDVICPQGSGECPFDKQKSNLSCKHMNDLCELVKLEIEKRLDEDAKMID